MDGIKAAAKIAISDNEGDSDPVILEPLNESVAAPDTPVEPEMRKSPSSGDDDELPAWATKQTEQLEEQANDFDMIDECDSFLRTLANYRVGNEWTFSEEEYVERLRQKLGEIANSVTSTLKAMRRKNAA